MALSLDMEILECRLKQAQQCFCAKAGGEGIRVSHRGLKVPADLKPDTDPDVIYLGQSGSGSGSFKRERPLLLKRDPGPESGPGRFRGTGRVGPYIPLPDADGGPDADDDAGDADDPLGGMSENQQRVYVRELVGVIDTGYQKES